MDFEDVVEEARRLEKKVSGYSPYAGEYDIAHTLDLEPKEFVDLTYQDLLNIYERTEKIRSAAGLGILVGEKKAAQAAAPSHKAEEVEAKLTELRTETLEKAEQVKKEELVIEKPQAAEKPPEEKLEIEFEHRPAEEIEFEKPAEKPPEMEKPEIRPEAKPEEKPEPVPLTPAAEAPPERKMVVAALPPSLRESPDEAGAKKYEQIEEQIRAALGGETDETTLKKKMLDLTKELFKEKSTGKRERIKLEITVLKNMLTAGGGAAKKRKKGGEEEETHSRVLETITATQQSELAQTKDSVINAYNRQTGAVKKKFHDDMVAAGEDAMRRKQVLETLVFSLTSLVEQLPGVIGKYEDFLAKKHSAEVEKLRESLGGKEKDAETKAKQRLGAIAAYPAEFATVKSIIAHDIDNIIEAAGREVFKKEGEKEDDETKARDRMIEINETDEGTLLYYLHSKEPEVYRKYEHKQISKGEALFRAKALMAKEKGISEEAIKKHFTEEG